MKSILRKILKYYLKIITRLVLLIHRPLVIGITGSINEVFTKAEIKRQLSETSFKVRSNPKNFNTEIGLPLAILNLPSGYDSYGRWIFIMWQALRSLFFIKFPKILVIGYGIAKPGDMKYLLSIIRPNIGIITDITQRYIDSFDNLNELVGEYRYFVKSIKKDGAFILNYDNRQIKTLVEISKNKNIFFGLTELPDGGVNQNDYYKAKLIKKTLNGQLVEVSNGGENQSYQINRFGQHHIYALLVGLIIKKIVLNLK